MTRTGGSRLRWAAAATAAILGISLMGSAASSSAEVAPTKDLSVDLATVTGPSTGVAQGILYGLSEDGSLPVDDYVEPLALNSYRGGGWGTGGWLGDGYQFGPKTHASIQIIIDQATRLKALSPDPEDFHYEVLLSDLWGSTGGTPATAQWPCTGGDCSNWIQFIEQTVGALEASGIEFHYEFWNEGDLAIFWRPGVNTPQYFQMWDSGYQTLRRVAAGSPIVGPSFANSPERNPSMWRTWLAHVKAADTVPDWISHHLLNGTADDPVVASRITREILDEAGVGQRPLSVNEYQGSTLQTADSTAWYINRLSQSSYDKAMRANWVCCMQPNLTGLLTRAQTGWAPTGNWWAMRTGAEMTGSLVQTSGQVDTMSISAAKDDSKQQVVALLGDQRGFTGSANVKFTGLNSTPYLVKNGKVRATVYGLTEGVLFSPAVRFSGELPIAADGSVTVPAEFIGAHDAAAVYLSWTQTQTLTIDAPEKLIPGQAYDVPVTIRNDSATSVSDVTTSLAVTADDTADTEGISITCSTGGSTCPKVGALAPSASTTATFHIVVPEEAPASSYRLVGTGTMFVDGIERTIDNSIELVATCDTDLNCEAEEGELVGGACIASNHEGYTGSGFAACFDTTSSGRGLTQRFSAETAGTYTLDLRYAAGPDGPFATADRTATLTANGVSQKIMMPPTGGWRTWGSVTVTVELTDGTNQVSIMKQAGDTGWFNLDHLVLHAPAPNGPDVAVTSSTRCVAGKVVLVVTAANQDQGTAKVTTETPYGTASFGEMPAGASATKALSTRKGSIPAGTMTTSATATGASTIETPVAAAFCG